MKTHPLSNVEPGIVYPMLQLLRVVSAVVQIRMVFHRISPLLWRPLMDFCAQMQLCRWPCPRLPAAFPERPLPKRKSRESTKATNFVLGREEHGIFNSTLLILTKYKATRRVEFASDRAIRHLLVPPMFSPRTFPVATVKTRAKELQRGTAKVRSEMESGTFNAESSDQNK